MARLARWYLALGMLAAVPAAAILGGGIGEWLRERTLASAMMAVSPAAVILAVSAAWLFATADGLHRELRSALILAAVEATLLIVLGFASLVGGGAFLHAIGLPEVFILAAIPAALGAVFFGARLMAALRAAAHVAAPFGLADLRALATLAGVALMGGLLQTLVGAVARA